MNKLQTELIEKREEVTAERFDEMLGALPPERMAHGGFLVGEPTDHGGKNSAARYDLYITENGKYYYAGLATCKDFDTFTIPAWRVILADMAEMKEDSDTATLEKVMDYYCSMWDIREGMKHAIALTLHDQYENHPEDQEDGEIEKLRTMLGL